MKKEKKNRTPGTDVERPGCKETRNSLKTKTKGKGVEGIKSSAKQRPTKVA
jgi:hypothetical protein